MAAAKKKKVSRGVLIFIILLLIGSTGYMSYLYFTKDINVEAQSKCNEEQPTETNKELSITDIYSKPITQILTLDLESRDGQFYDADNQVYKAKKYALGQDYYLYAETSKTDEYSVIPGLCSSDSDCLALQNTGLKDILFVYLLKTNNKYRMFAIKKDNTLYELYINEYFSEKNLNIKNIVNVYLDNNKIKAIDISGNTYDIN